MFEILPIFLAAAEASGGGVIESIQQGFGIRGHLLFGQMLNFCIVAALLWYFAFKPVMVTIAERQKTIADGLQYAEEMKERLEDAEKQHAETLKKASQEAQQMLHEARANAKAFEDKKMHEITARAEGVLKKAEEAIELEKQQMLNEVRQEVARLVVLTSSKVLDRELSADERNRYGEAAARELASRN